MLGSGPRSEEVFYYAEGGIAFLDLRRHRRSLSLNGEKNKITCL